MKPEKKIRENFDILLAFIDEKKSQLSSAKSPTLVLELHHELMMLETRATELQWVLSE